MVTWTIRLVVLVAFLDLFMQLPVVATYAQALGATAAMGGAIVGTYSAANLVGNVCAGLMLDRLNRKWLVALGMLLTAGALFLYGFVESWPQLLVLRAFHGLFAGVLAPGAFALLGDRTRGEQTRSMGVTGALISIAAVVGPPVSGIILDSAGFQAVFTTSGALMLLAGVVFLLRVPDLPTPKLDVANQIQPVPSRLGEGVLIRVSIAVLAMTYCIGALVGELPVAIEIAGGSSRVAGAAFATFSLVAAAVMAIPALRGFDRVSRSTTVAIGLGLLGISTLTLAVFYRGIPHVEQPEAMLLTAYSWITPGTLGAMVTFGVGFGLLFPTLSAAVAEHTPSRRRGSAYGIFYAAYSLGVFLGAVFSGSVAELATNLGAPYLLSSAIALAAIPVAIGIRATR